MAALIWGALLFSACDKSPWERTKGDNGSAAAIGGSGSGTFPIYVDELVSGGGAFEYPGSSNLSLDFADRSSPIGERSIRFSWNGQSSDGTTTSFAGFSLMHVAQFSQYTSTPGRDLQAAGYTKVRFSARGELATANSLKVEAGGPSSACIALSSTGLVDACGNGQRGVLSGDWRSYEFSISPAQQSAIKDLIKFTFIFDNPTPGSTAPGQGGVVYLDNVSYGI